MRLSAQRAGWVAGAAFGIMVVLSTVLLAGGSGFDDDHEHDAEQESLVFFGFVKDTRGSIVADAKVTVGIKAVGEVVTRSNILGAYRVSGFRNDIDQKTIEVLCEKQGYKYLRSFRRSAETQSAKTPIEMECVMQRV
jgi:hypothetical protein